MAIDLTFIVWADTHCGYEQRFGRDDQRYRIVEQINTLAGWPYPAWIGGCVGRPAFVAHLGDMVEGGPPPGHDAERDYFLHLKNQLRLPQYELLGNHDATAPMHEWFERRYHTPSYSFDMAGVRFIFLRVDFGPMPQSGGQEHVHDDQIDWLKQDLASVAPATPVVLFVHSPIERCANSAALLDVLEPYNVVLSMAGHLHRQRVYETGPIACVDIGQCRDHPNDPALGRTISVVHLTDDRLTVVPWRWDLVDWERGQGIADPDSYAQLVTLDKTLGDAANDAAPVDEQTPGLAEEHDA